MQAGNGAILRDPGGVLSVATGREKSRFSPSYFSGGVFQRTRGGSRRAGRFLRYIDYINTGRGGSRSLYEKAGRRGLFLYWKRKNKKIPDKIRTDAGRGEKLRFSLIFQGVRGVFTPLLLIVYIIQL